MSITVEGLTHIYDPDGPMSTLALKDIDLTIERGDFVGIIGHTGSGKSTLVQYFNGLLIPGEGDGRVIVDDQDTRKPAVKMQDIRRRVGLVFQYPEHQLFEETVAEDVAFGPRNLNLGDDEVLKRVKEAMWMVGLEYEALKDRSPFSLSGGQMRRAAIAGVLAMEPEYLILDEPTAGLDPRGRDEILERILNLHDQGGLTVILVSHSMEDIARLVNRLVVLHEGHLVYSGDPREIFQKSEQLRDMGLDIPQVMQLMLELRRRGKDVRTDIFTIREACEELIKIVRSSGTYA